MNTFIVKDNLGNDVTVFVDWISEDKELTNPMTALMTVINELNLHVWRNYKNDDDIESSPYDYFEIINEMTTNSRLETLHAGIIVDPSTGEKTTIRVTEMVDGSQLYIVASVIWTSRDSWESIAQLIEQVFHLQQNSTLSKLKMFCLKTRRELIREYS